MRLETALRIRQVGEQANSEPARQEPWLDLAPHYELARAKEDSLDRLVEWPAQQEMLGDVSGLSILDLGCGNGAKLAELVARGARECVGVDVSGHFIANPPRV